MPVRPHTRDQAWLLPPSLDETVAADHPARFVAAFVDAIGPQAWADLTIEPAGDARGAPAYHPRLLLSVWLYGFMSGVRSSRKLEAACREQLPYLWLTGGQQPDHNTLWRFYQAHREGMRGLLRRTVQTAVQAGLVDLALQAVDGSKIAANASGWRTGDATMLARLLARTDEAIAELEAQNVTDETPVAPRLPQALAQAQALRDRVQQALAQIDEADGPRRVNLTDADARLLKAADGYVTGYNAQAMASPPHDRPRPARDGGRYRAGERPGAAGTHAGGSGGEHRRSRRHDPGGQRLPRGRASCGRCGKRPDAVDPRPAGPRAQSAVPQGCV